MMRGEEGKLLAGAAEFLFTLGERTDEQTIEFCAALLLSCKKEPLCIIRLYCVSVSLPSG